MGLCHLQAKPFLAHTTREFIFSAWLSPPIWLEHAAIMFHHQFKSWWGTVDLQTRSDNSHNFYHWINTMNRQWKRFFLQFEGHCTTDYSTCEENWFHHWFMDWTDSENILMMRTCMNVLLETLPCFRNRLVWLLLEAWDSSRKGVGLAHRNNFLRNALVHLSQVVASFCWRRTIDSPSQAKRIGKGEGGWRQTSPPWWWRYHTPPWSAEGGR